VRYVTNPWLLGKIERVLGGDKSIEICRKANLTGTATTGGKKDVQGTVSFFFR
jgi:hypothetical protein